MSGFVDGLTHKRASTAPDAVDPRLRGRTYTIPFDQAWQAAVGICRGGIRGWSVVRTNDETGVIEALVQPGPFSKHADVRVVVALDRLAQTRVDLTIVSRTGRGDFGRSTRLVDRFLQKLDAELGAGPDTILDPARLAAFFGEIAPPPPADSTGEALPSEPGTEPASR